ncbi:MAG: hypothetical protein HYY26_07785 [Acidobacteria bacterium]|nr:hypothetical protein [Acidobacteriota bacterium]
MTGDEERNHAPEQWEEAPLSSRIQRTGPPVKIRLLGDGGAIYQAPLNAGPNRLWRSLFLEQTEYKLDFVPSLVRFTYQPPAVNFEAQEWQFKDRLRLIDAWLEATNRRCARPPSRGPGGPLDTESREPGRPADPE